MLKHETKLIDPDAAQIVGALTAATADANKRCRARLLKDDPAKWRKFARDAAAKPEGYAMFRGGKGGVPATQILAAWWTDSIGRKHVVVRGRRLEYDEAKRMLHAVELDKRPPLWHAYPEYVCRRVAGGGSQVVCACGCGAVGSPESLGWMGETCGPCFDRKEELGAAGLRGNFPGVLYSDREPLGAVACSPDGTRIAAVEGAGSVTYWDLATRTRTVMKFSGIRVMDVAITSDGRRLLVAGMNAILPVGGLCAAFDLDADPPARIDSANEDSPACWRVAALPDPGLALVHRWDADNSVSRVELVRVPSGEVVRGANFSPGYHGPLAVSLDGRRFATPGDPVTVFDASTMRPLSQARGRHAHAAFSPDGARLTLANLDSLRAYDADTGRPSGLFGMGGKRIGTYANWVSALAVDPTGEYVFVGGSSGVVSVVNAQTLDRHAVLEWHLGVVRSLAVSADGSRLFSSGGDGCVKVWPIRDLLRGV